MVSPRKLKKLLKAALSSLLPNNSSSWVYKTQGASFESPSPAWLQQPARPAGAGGRRRRVWPWVRHRGITEPDQSLRPQRLPRTGTAPCPQHRSAVRLRVLQTQRPPT